MAPLALLFKEAGVEVTGSDLQAYPPMGDMLHEAGITIRMGYDPGNIASDIDVVIVGNAIAKDNPEVKEVIRKEISMYSFPQALSHYFLDKRIPLVVVGTHGKTTSSALLAWVLEFSMQNPGFLIGGVPINFCKNSRLGTGPYFVVEGDEYDSAFFDKRPKFLHYIPKIALFTSLEYDHADIFPSFETLREQFHKFVQLLPKEGSLLVCADYPDALEVAQAASCRVETYGLTEQAQWRAVILEESKEGVSADILYRQERIETICSPLAGSHNLQNVVGIIALCRLIRLSMEVIKRGLKTFLGVRRRQEVVGEQGGIIVVDDFAHHPTAVRETMRAVKGKFRGRRLVTVFEPRTNTSRRNVFQKEFVDAFEEADVAICSEIYKSEKIPLGERFSPERWAYELKLRGKEAYWFAHPEEIIRFLVDQCKPDDVVLVMSSGHFENLPM
jgi:UDP-N-acetylmuramate: L-alanyl-gamma-D-glutamyl-meso-diaminopimelate ligase